MNKLDPQGARILAIDYGEKRIGLAFSERESGIATAWRTVPTSDFVAEWPAIEAMQQPDIIVVGRPRSLDGELTPQSARVDDFVDQLQRYTKIPIVRQDETLSTEEGGRRLPNNLTERQRREHIDAMAAQVILEDYLS